MTKTITLVLSMLLVSNAYLTSQNFDFFITYGDPTQYFDATAIQAHSSSGAWILASISKSTEYEHDQILYHVDAEGEILDSTRFQKEGWQENGRLSRFGNGDLLIGTESRQLGVTNLDDILITRYSEEGLEQSSFIVGTEYDDNLLQLEVSSDNNILLYSRAFMYPYILDYHDQLTKLDSTGELLWQEDTRNAPYNLNHLSQVRPLPNDEFLLIGRSGESSRAAIMRINAEGEVIWRLEANGSDLPFDNSFFNNVFVDTLSQKVLLINLESSSIIFTFLDYNGNILGTAFDFEFTSTINQSFRKEDRVVIMTPNKIKRFQISFDTYSILDFVESDNQIDDDDIGVILEDNTVMTISENGELTYFPLLKGTAQRDTIGVPYVRKIEAFYGLGKSITDSHLWVVKKENSLQKSIQKISPTGSELAEISLSKNDVFPCDIIEIENTNIVRSFSKSGSTLAAPDTVGFQIFNPEGTLLEEYINTDVNFSGLVATYIEPLTQNDFAVLLTNSIGGRSELIIQNDDFPEPIHFDDFNPINLKFTSSRNHDQLAFIGVDPFDHHVLSISALTLQGEVVWENSIALEPGQVISGYNIKGNPVADEFGIVVSHSDEIGEGYGLKFYTISTEGVILSSRSLNTPPQSFCRHLALEYHNDGKAAIIASQLLYATSSASHSYYIDYTLLDPSGDELLYFSNPTTTYLTINKSVITNQNVVLLSGIYDQIGRDADAIILSLLPEGNIANIGASLAQISMLKLWPQPISSQKLELSLENDYQGPLKIMIWNNSGQLADQLSLQKNTKLLREQIEVRHLSAGQYWLECKTSDGQRIVKAFVRQ